MSKRWEPKKGETYFVINAMGSIESFAWKDDGIDKSLYTIGNCFETRTEAKSASEKFTALLLNLHGEQPVTACNNLPKLTAEVFDRPDCPVWAKYAAVDSDGDVRYHERYPRLSKYWWVSDGSITGVNYGKFDATDWQNSLIERPAKLPDWCKVGEWCFCLDDDGNCKYFKITKIKDNFIYGDDWDIDYHFVKQARLRPYNAEELKGLVGKVIDNPCSSRLVTAYNESDCIKILISIGWYTADDLMTSDYTIDGKPCGVLEHLSENGEWVE